MITISNTIKKSGILAKALIKSTNEAVTMDWIASDFVLSGEFRNFSGNRYVSSKSGLTGNTGPVHTSGLISDGGISWIYISKQVSATTLYFGIGADSETIPTETISESFLDAKTTIDNISGLAKISADINLYISRNDWTTATIYDQVDTFPKVNTYAVFSDRKVFVCIYSPGTASTIQPTIEDTIEYADGYVWKYLYTVEDKTLITSDFIPSINTNLPNREIEFIRVLTGGTNYDPSTTLSLNSGSAIIQPTIVGGVITGITVLDGGEDYETLPTIVVTNQGSGTGATFEIIISNYVDIDSLVGANSVRLFSRIIESESGVFPTSINFELSILLNVRSDGNVSTFNYLLGAAHADFGMVGKNSISGNPDILSLIMLDDANKIVHSDVDITNLNYFISF